MRDVFAFADEMRDARVEIDLFQAAVEMQTHAHRLRGVQQHDVQIAAADRPDHFAVVLAVALQLHAAIREMHHAPAHHHRLLQHVVVDTGGAQRVQAALGQCEIDRAAAGIAMYARVAATLEQVHLPALPREQRREQWARQAGADEGEAFVFCGAHDSCTHTCHSCTARAKRRMSL